MAVNTTSIQTKYGLFDYADIKNSKIDIRDIGHALAKINRFNGQSDVPFSVAQHSMFVTALMYRDNQPIKIQKYGLLHDGHESYYCDFPRPLKIFLKQSMNFDINAITDEVDNFIYKEIFNLPAPTEDEKNIIKYYDNMALYNEKTYLFERSIEWGWDMPLVGREDFQFYLNGTWKDWANMLINRTAFLKGNIEIW